MVPRSTVIEYNFRGMPAAAVQRAAFGRDKASAKTHDERRRRWGEKLNYWEKGEDLLGRFTLDLISLLQEKRRNG